MKKNIKIIVGVIVIGIGIYVAFNWKVISRQIGLLGEKFITKVDPADVIVKNGYATF